MKITEVGHLDHGLSHEQIEFIKAKFADRDAFFIESFELPEDLGMVPCGLYGPLMGDAPVRDARDEVRGTRAWTSRIVDRPTRPTRTVTVIAGPHEDEPCVLYTAFGGPRAPQDPGDPTCRDKTASQEFWRDHALSSQ